MQTIKQTAFTELPNQWLELAGSSRLRAKLHGPFRHVQLRAVSLTLVTVIWFGGMAAGLYAFINVGII